MTRLLHPRTISVVLRKLIAHLEPVIRLRPRAIRHYIRYFRDWRIYQAMDGAETLRFRDAKPMLFDRTKTTPFDTHYFYQSLWAAQAIFNSKVALHVDVGSWTVYAGLLTPFTKVVFVDIRPLNTEVGNMRSVSGSLLRLPFADNSVVSLSCLHVVEHIGLGRYGDPLDPYGSKKAIAELVRVLAPGGMLYFSTPIGAPRVNFNAHRVFSPNEIITHFASLQLVEFSVVTDSGQLVMDTCYDEYESALYSCGLFRLTKKC